MAFFLQAKSYLEANVQGWYHGGGEVREVWRSRKLPAPHPQALGSSPRMKTTKFPGLWGWFFSALR